MASRHREDPMFDGGRGMIRAAALSLLLAAAAAAPSSAQAQSWRTLTSSRQIWGEEPVEVQVEYGAGTLEIGRAESASLLYRMELRYDEERVTPVAEFDTAARRLELGVRNREHSGHNMKEGSKAEITLSDRVPLDLDLHFGAGEAEMELGGLQIRRFSLETGASKTTVRFGQPNRVRAEEVQLKAGAAELTVIGLGNLRAERISFQGGVGSTTLDFGGSWDANASATVQMGMGSVVLRIPRSLGVRIDRSSFLTSFEADDFVRRDGSYFSENWSGSARQLTVEVEAALGSVEVQWIDG
jgi:hypothetical protein